MNMRYLLLGIVIVIVATSGCTDVRVEPTQNKSIRNNIAENTTAENVAIENGIVFYNLSIINRDDYIFMTAVLNSKNIIAEDKAGLLYAIASNDNKNFHIFGKRLKDDSRLYIYKINKLAVSSPMVPMLDEYNTSLAILAYTGKFTGFNHIESMNNDRKRALLNFMNRGVSHFNNVTIAINEDYPNDSNITTMQTINIDRTIEVGDLILK